jgi:hypothetical protein
MVTPALSTIGLSEKARNEWTSSDLRIHGSKELLTEDIGREREEECDCSEGLHRG